MLHLVNLRCEYLNQPLGVGTAEPRFSWQLVDPEHVRGSRPSAYQVVVERLTNDKPMSLWDSGRVASDQSVNVEYAGEPVQSAWDCRWRVRVWDQAGFVCRWTPLGWLNLVNTSATARGSAWSAGLTVRRGSN